MGKLPYRKEKHNLGARKGKPIWMHVKYEKYFRPRQKCTIASFNNYTQAVAGSNGGTGITASRIKSNLIGFSVRSLFLCASAAQVGVHTTILRNAAFCTDYYLLVCRRQKRVSNGGLIEMSRVHVAHAGSDIFL